MSASSVPQPNVSARKGLDDVAIADLMKETGLTVGGFYKHFHSRDDLLVESLRAASGPWQRQLSATQSGGPPLTYESLIDSYLSEAHRDHPGIGCPVSALACDIARSSRKIRFLLTEKVESYFELFANLLPQDDSAARSKAILIVFALLDAVQLARAASDHALSDEILESTREVAEAAHQAQYSSSCDLTELSTRMAETIFQFGDTTIATLARSR